ncbi:hypothetical protein POF50_027450 [Streptomyces sp. SL13]|uniref:Uncharacterized protein n=1 Tax=Streptantibioticus silvisoli TaxID=2705255 RepID=A0AA90H9Y1_9ACTN|nr:hypothetical protein [Streptantibioticus silvisoli]
MPLIPEEPQIHESVTGPLAAAGGTRTPQAPRPVPVPGPRPGPRPAPPRATRTHSSPGRPGPVRPAQANPQPQQTGGSPQIQLVSATVATAVSAADDAVDNLLDSGRAPTDILVLTSGDQHPWAQHELSFGAESYWRQQDEAGDVFYAAATAAQAVKRPVVVLAMNDGTDEATSAALPAALALAGEILVFCGDPERVNTLM